MGPLRLEFHRARITTTLRCMFYLGKLIYQNQPLMRSVSASLCGSGLLIFFAGDTASEPIWITDVHIGCATEKTGGPGVDDRGAVQTTSKAPVAWASSANFTTMMDRVLCLNKKSTFPSA